MHSSVTVLTIVLCRHRRRRRPHCLSDQLAQVTQLAQMAQVTKQAQMAQVIQLAQVTQPTINH